MTFLYNEAIWAHGSLATAHDKFEEHCGKVDQVLSLCTSVTQINTVFETADTVIKPLANLVPGLLGSLVKVLVTAVDPIVERISGQTARAKNFCATYKNKLKLQDLSNGCQGAKSFVLEAKLKLGLILAELDQTKKLWCTCDGQTHPVRSSEAESACSDAEADSSQGQCIAATSFVCPSGASTDTQNKNVQFLAKTHSCIGQSVEAWANNMQTLHENLMVAILSTKQRLNELAQFQALLDPLAGMTEVLPSVSQFFDQISVLEGFTTKIQQFQTFTITFSLCDGLGYHNGGDGTAATHSATTHNDDSLQAHGIQTGVWLYAMGVRGSAFCPDGFAKIQDKPRCEAAVQALGNGTGGPMSVFRTTSTSVRSMHAWSYTSGCVLDTSDACMAQNTQTCGNLWWNTDGEHGQANARGTTICASPPGGLVRDHASGTVTQSSTAAGGAATRAVDGNQNQQWGGGSCTHTNNQASTPVWWQLDLGSPKSISYVKVWNRVDCCNDRLHGATVNVDNQWCGTLTSTTNVQTVQCDGLSGQTIKIERAHGILTLCEVEVYSFGGNEEVELLSRPKKGGSATRRLLSAHAKPTERAVGRNPRREALQGLKRKLKTIQAKYPDPKDRHKVLRDEFLFTVDRKLGQVQIMLRTNATIATDARSIVTANSTQLMQFGAVADAAEWVGDVAGDAWDWLEDTYDDTTDWIAETATALATALCDGFEFNVWEIVMGIGNIIDTLDVFNVKDLVAEAITSVLDALGLNPAQFLPDLDLTVLDVDLPDPPEFTFDFSAVSHGGANFLSFNWAGVGWETDLLDRMATEQDFTCGTSSCAQG